MRLIERFRRRRVMKSYVRKLPAVLHKRYGRSDSYTPEQIRSATIEADLDIAYLWYAYAMYLRREEFEQLQRELGEEVRYDTMRGEVGEAYFGGDPNFSVADLEPVDRAGSGWVDGGSGFGISESGADGGSGGSDSGGGDSGGGSDGGGGSSE